MALEALESLGLPPAEGGKTYDTAYGEQKGCNLHLHLDDKDDLAAKGLPDDGSNRSEYFLHVCSKVW